MSINKLFQAFIYLHSIIEKYYMKNKFCLFHCSELPVEAFNNDSWKISKIDIFSL